MRPSQEQIDDLVRWAMDPQGTAGEVGSHLRVMTDAISALGSDLKASQAALSEARALLDTEHWNQYVCEAAFDDDDEELTSECDGFEEMGGRPCWEHKRRAFIARPK